MAFDADEQLLIIPTVADLSAHMIESFKQWSDDDWQRDSCCVGWTRADVVAHVTTGTDYRTQVLKLGLIDQPIFPWGATSLDEVRNLRAQAVEDLCRRGPQALLDGFTDAVHQHQEVLVSLKRSDLVKVARYPRGMVPIGEWIGMQLLELIVHDWDMRRPADPLARLTSFAVEPALTLLPESQVRFLSHRLMADGSVELKDGDYVIRAGTMAWALRIRNRNVSYQARPHTSFRTACYSDAETLILLSLGRIDIASQLALGTCRFEGNPEVDTAVYELLFRSYISASVIAPEQR